VEQCVKSLVCPPNPSSATGITVNFQPTIDAFCALFTCVLRYIYDCILGQLIFCCPHPSTSGEVILGTVEIRNGRLVRVCHCHRSYVWAAANFWQVLIATLVEYETCHPQSSQSTTSSVFEPVSNVGSDPHADKPKTKCCPELEINCRTFVLLYHQDNKWKQTATMAPLAFAKSFANGARQAFSIFNPNAVPAQIFAGMAPNDATELAKKVGVNLFVSPTALPHAAISYFQQALVNVLGQPGDTLAASVADGKVVNLADHPALVEAFAMIENLNNTIGHRDETIKDLHGRMDALTARMDAMDKGGGQ
jgi:hypothetical protein